jgi:hypothetical protein
MSREETASVPGTRTDPRRAARAVKDGTGGSFPDIES